MSLARKRNANDKRTKETPETKKQKTSIIDDDVAVTIFRELGLDDAFLNSGKVLAWAVQPDDEAFTDIHDYVTRSQDKNSYCKILSILRVIPKADNLATSSLDFNEDPETKDMHRMMLWHGTKKDNIPSILQNGLRLPTIDGYYGVGIYFADRLANSAEYCDYDDFDYATMSEIGYLFLCDVLLGNSYESLKLMEGDYVESPPDTHGKGWTRKNNSVKGCGTNVPDEDWNKTVDGCTWPLGPTVKTKIQKRLPVNMNEYVVFSTKHVQPKYLVKVEFTTKPVHENIC